MLDFDDRSRSLPGNKCDFDDTEVIDPYFDTQCVYKHPATTEQLLLLPGCVQKENENENEVVLDSEDDDSLSFHGETHRRLLSGNAGVEDNDEPGEASQAYALDFVEQFVSRNGKDLSVEGDARKLVKERMPSSSSAKGITSVAKLVGWRRSIGKMEVFEWVDDPCPESVIKEGMEVNQRTVEKQLDCGDAKTRGNELKDENLIMNCPKKRFPVIDLNTVYEEGSSEEVRHNIDMSNVKFRDGVVELPDQHADGEDFAGLSKAVDVGRERDEMFDVGVCTQMAAEAMEALSRACTISNACVSGDIHDNLVDSPIYVDPSSPCNSPFLKSSDGMGESKDRVCPPKRCRGTTKSSVEHHKKQKLEHELATPKKAKGDILFFRHYTRKKRSKYQIPGVRSCKQVNEKTIEAIGLNNPEENDAFAEASVSHDHKICGLRQSQRELNKYNATSEAGQPSSGPKTRSNKDLVHYVRKRKKIVPFEQVSSLNYSKVPSKPPGRIRNQLTSLETPSNCSKQMVLGKWSYPKGKRTPRSSAKNVTYSDLLQTPLRQMGLKGKKAFRRSEDRLDDSCFDNGGKEKLHSLSNSCQELPSPRTDCARNLLTPDKTRLSSPLQDISNQESAVKMSRVDSVNAKVFKQSSQAVASNITEVVRGVEESLPCIPSVNKVVSSGSRSSIFSLAKNVNPVGTKGLRSHHQKRSCCNTPWKSIVSKELGRLGICNSVPDFKWKDLRKRRHMAYVRVLFSQHLDDTIIRQQKKIMARLGIPTALSSQEATHFVADKFARTRNMLEAIALGKPVVTHLWIESCGQAGCLVDEKNFILRDAKKEKEFSFNMSASLARASQHGLLEGRRVFITPNIKPNEEMITSLVKLLRGQVISRSCIAAEMDQRNPDDILILSCLEDRAVCVPFLEKGAAIYSSELLLNGVLSQKLDYSRHQLFTTHPNRR